jgi:hypothetical protein
LIPQGGRLLCPASGQGQDRLSKTPCGEGRGSTTAPQNNHQTTGKRNGRVPGDAAARHREETPKKGGGVRRRDTLLFILQRTKHKGKPARIFDVVQINFYFSF